MSEDSEYVVIDALWGETADAYWSPELVELESENSQFYQDLVVLRVKLRGTEENVNIVLAPSEAASLVASLQRVLHGPTIG